MVHGFLVSVSSRKQGTYIKILKQAAIFWKLKGPLNVYFITYLVGGKTSSTPMSTNLFSSVLDDDFSGGGGFKGYAPLSCNLN